MVIQDGASVQRIVVVVARSPGRSTSGLQLHMVAGHAHLAKAGVATRTPVGALAMRRIITATEVETPFTSTGTMLPAAIANCQGGSLVGAVGTGPSISGTHVAIPQ